MTDPSTNSETDLSKTPEKIVTNSRFYHNPWFWYGGIAITTIASIGIFYFLGGSTPSAGSNIPTSTPINSEIPNFYSSGSLPVKSADLTKVGTPITNSILIIGAKIGQLIMKGVNQATEVSDSGITGSVLTGGHGVALSDIQRYSDLINELSSIIRLKTHNHEVWTIEQLQLLEEFQVKYSYFISSKHDRNPVMIKSFIKYLEQIRDFLIK